MPVVPIDFSKVDAILRHLQQTEQHDWLGEVTFCGAQVCYLLLQNYNISRLNFYNYNSHLIVLTVLFFAQRIWFYIWRLTQISDAHGLRFVCHFALFLVALDSVYCGMQLVLRDPMPIVGAIYLAAPLLSSLIFYNAWLKSNTNVFTAELFGMLWRCVYHSLETAYCIGILPLRFLQYEYLYYDLSRCIVLTIFSAAHSFVMLLCLELHCLGSEVLQQAKMLGEWRWIADISTMKSISPRPSEWTYRNCPYPQGSVVRCKGRYYEAKAKLNTCTPSCPSRYISPILFLLGDSKRTKALVLAALLFLNTVLLNLVWLSNQWSSYAVMLALNFGHFVCIKCRSTHSFFNPEQLRMERLLEAQGCPLNSAMFNHGDLRETNRRSNRFSSFISRRSGYSDDYREAHYNENHENHLKHHGFSEDSGGRYSAHLNGDGINGDHASAFLQCPNPLFMSAVSASTMFFFGSGTQGRASGHPDLSWQDGPQEQYGSSAD